MKKILAAMLAIFVVLAGLVGCSSPETSGAGDSTAESQEPSSAPNETGGEIVVWTFLNPADETGRGKVLANVMEKFENTYQTSVKVESLQWDTLSAKFLSAHQTGTAPDVVFLNTSDLAQALAIGALEPLDDLFLNEWSEEDLEDINDSRFQMGVNDGKHYQVFLFANVWGILYRPSLFESKGVAPSFDTWEDLAAAAHEMTFVDEDGNQVYGLGTGYSETSADSSLLMAYLFCQHGSVVDENGQPRWTGDDAAQMLQMEIDLINDGVMPESVLTSTSDEIYTDFMAGKYAMMTGGTVRIPTIQSQCVFDPSDVAIAAFPQEEGAKANSFVGGWNAAVWSGSENKEAAGRFIEMMVSPEFDQQWVSEGGQLPMRKSTMTSMADYFNDPLQAFIPEAMELLTASVADDTNFITSGYKADLNRTMQYAFADGYSVTEALEKSASEFLEATGN